MPDCIFLQLENEIHATFRKKNLPKSPDFATNRGDFARRGGVPTPPRPRGRNLAAPPLGRRNRRNRQSRPSRACPPRAFGESGDARFRRLRRGVDCVDAWPFPGGSPPRRGRSTTSTMSTTSTTRARKPEGRACAERSGGTTPDRSHGASATRGPIGLASPSQPCRRHRGGSRGRWPGRRASTCSGRKTRSPRPC